MDLPVNEATIDHGEKIQEAYPKFIMSKTLLVSIVVFFHRKICIMIYAYQDGRSCTRGLSVIAYRSTSDRMNPEISHTISVKFSTM